MTPTRFMHALNGALWAAQAAISFVYTQSPGLGVIGVTGLLLALVMWRLEI